MLRLDRIPTPQAGDDDVLIRVEAAGVDQGVWHLVAGLPYAVRLAGHGLRVPKQRVPGGGTFVAAERAADLAALTELVEAGQVAPAVDRRYPLAEAAAAIRDLREGRIRGKAVVVPRP